MSTENSIQMDQDFPRRVTWTSTVFGIFLCWFLMSVQLMNHALAYGLGAGVGIYSYEVFRMAGRVFLRTQEMKEENPISLWKKWVVAGLFSIKIPLWIFAIYAAVADPYLSVLVFAGGISTPHMVMLSKVASKMLVSGPITDERNEQDEEISIHNQTDEAKVT